VTTTATLERSIPLPSFRELDDLILHLKGVVLVNGLRERDGADDTELDMYRTEIERLRDQLAEVVRSTARR
jgi:hypothetical protein